jgi:hypothetical protein
MGEGLSPISCRAIGEKGLWRSPDSECGQRIYGEKGWAVFVQQGGHGCILSGCIHDRPLADAMWEALSVWADFEPRSGLPDSHEEWLFVPEGFACEMEEAWDHLEDLDKRPCFSKLLGCCRKTMRDFSLGFRKFATPFLGPVVDSPVGFQSYARAAAISRLRPVQDGLDYWQRIAPAPPPTPSSSTQGAVWPGSSIPSSSLGSGIIEGRDGHSPAIY